MKTISVSPYVPGGAPRVQTTEYGDFTVELTHRGYSEHHYRVELVSGEWPTNKDEIGRWLDHRWDYFGGKVILKGSMAAVVCYVD